MICWHWTSTEFVRTFPTLMQMKSQTSFSSVGAPEQTYPKEIQSPLGLNLLSQSQSEQSQCSPACWYFTHSGKIDLVQFSPKNFQLLILTAVLAAAMKTLFSTLANSPITKHLCGEEQNILITSCGTSKSWLENIVCIVSNIVCNIPTFYFSLPSLILTEKSGFWHASHK